MRGVIDIGAHKFEEENLWKAQGAKNFVLFEPVKANFEYLQKVASSYLIFNIALADYTGYMDMHIDPGHDNLSASLLKPTKHCLIYPNIEFDRIERVKVDRLDNIIFDRGDYDHIQLYAQGLEVAVLRGSTETLKCIETITSQVYFECLYEGSCIMEEVVEYLNTQGFDLVSGGCRGRKAHGLANFKRRINTN